MIKIAVTSGKGGVGKSTVAANLALALSKKYKTGLLDVDIHGPSIPKMMGLDKVRGVSESKEKGKMEPVIFKNLRVFSIGFLLPSSDTPVVWRGPMKHGFIKQAYEQVNWDVDYLVIDHPPGTGDEAISVMQLVKPDVVVTVTTPQSVAFEEVKKTINFVIQTGEAKGEEKGDGQKEASEEPEKTAPVIGLVENMSGLICPHCSQVIDVFGAGGGKKLAEEMNIPFMGSIPLNPQVSDSGEKGKPIVETDEKIAEIFDTIIDFIIEKAEKEVTA
ncbi:MAG: Mrp/NBP35 family ATP-binding protein [Halobacteriota archaeon]